MNTNVLPPLAAAPSRADRTTPRLFYIGIATVLAFIIFLAFARTYWIPLAEGSSGVHSAIHVHAMLYFAWTALFFTQALLAARGHIALHQRLGLFGIALAGAMVLSGLLAAVVTMNGALGTPREPIVRANTALSLGAMLMFSTFMGLAVVNLAKPNRHKRFIVLAMFSILQAAIARIIMLVPSINHPLRTLLGAIAVDVLLLMVIALDARKHGRIHPVYVGGLVFLLIVQIVRRAVLNTPQWIEFTNWMAGLAG